MEEGYLEKMTSEFRNLTDAVLLVSDQQLPVHKAIIAANSSVLAQMFDLVTPTSSDKFQVSLDEEIDVVRQALSYLYETCKIGATMTRLRSCEDAAKLAAFAHKYDVQGMLNVCERYLIDAVQHLPRSTPSSDNSAVEWAVLADRYDMYNLLAQCEFHLLKFCSTASFWTDTKSVASRLSSESLRRIIRATKTTQVRAHHFIEWRNSAQQYKRHLHLHRHSE